MVRFVSALLVLLAPLAAHGVNDGVGAYHRAAQPELLQDGAGLVREGDRLHDGERHFLPPLSQHEVEQLFGEDESKPGVPKIGIVRNLTAPVGITRRALDRSAKMSGSATVGGWRRTDAAGARTIWTTSVSSPGAESLRLRFDRLELPDAARVFVYGDGDERYGPYTRTFVGDVTKGVHPFWTHTIQGNVAFVEVQFDDASAEVDLTIDGVGHFEGSPESLVAQPEGEECFRDTACAEDDAGLVKALSTATAQLRYRSGGSFYVCTGTLVNVSSTEEFEPYLLTANHCFSSQESASSLEAWWDFRSDTCGGAAPSKTSLPKVVGSTLLASDSSSDFTFVRLSSNPAGSTHADGTRFYLGWNANRPPAETLLYRASHPGGGVQKWSRTIVLDARGQTCTALPESRYIYSYGQYGGTSGGSSGGSAANASGQIVGQNYGKCGTDLTDPCKYSGANTVDGAFTTTYPFVSTWLQPQVETAPCVPDNGTLCLQSGRFEVKLSALDQRSGKVDSGHVMSTTDTYGVYAFPVIASNQTDPQIFVKILDGRPVNGRWWVFYASLTDVEFVLHVRDTKNSATKSYRQAPYTQQSQNDTNAFAD